MSLRKNKVPRRVYLDYAATTPVRREVARAMAPFFVNEFGNPATLYRLGTAAYQAVSQSRTAVASALSTTPDTIVFTSGGTEANNLALFGLGRQTPPRFRHLVTTAIEHRSVLEPARQLQKEGWRVSYIPVNADGLVDPRQVLRVLRPTTALVSVMQANNEIGAVQPIAEIGRQLLKFRRTNSSSYPYFHTDACQAVSYLELAVDKLHVDLLSISASKLYGPKGAGALYIRRGVPLLPLLMGGGQEAGRRAGTENVPGIVGLGAAVTLGVTERDDVVQRMRALAGWFWNQLRKQFPGVRLLGPPPGSNRLPHNLNIIFPDVEGETLVLYLDRGGISCSTAAACASLAQEPSQVLSALGLSNQEIAHAVRFSLGQSTTRQDLNYVLRSLNTIQRIFKHGSAAS